VASHTLTHTLSLSLPQLRPFSRPPVSRMLRRQCVVQFAGGRGVRTSLRWRGFNRINPGAVLQKRRIGC
jgi:hypothetical protein